jgi:hypothetical protein
MVLQWRWGRLGQCQASSCMQDRAWAPHVNASRQRPGCGPEPAGVIEEQGQRGVNLRWSGPRTLTNCLDSGSERVDKIGYLCSDG